MLPINPKTLKNQNTAASKRRQHFLFNTSIVSFFAILILVGLAYALFYAPWFKVRNVEYSGLSPEHQAQIQPIVAATLAKKFLGMPSGDDTLLISSGKLEAQISQLAFLKDVTVSKNYPHTLKISGTEREAEGVWCFDPPTGDCKYFDQSGVTWGQAIQSSGTLVLDVDDYRIASGSLNESSVDPQFLSAIKTVVSGLEQQGVKFKRVEIPQSGFTEFDVVTNDYPIKFSLDSDLVNQLKVYQIFADQKLASGSFQPQYLDLRYDGRVYYK